MTPIEELINIVNSCIAPDYIPTKIKRIALKGEQEYINQQIEAKVKEAVEEKENDIIGFAEWLTEKHTLTLIELYKIYNKEYKK